jgi:hypothetical protein
MMIIVSDATIMNIIKIVIDNSTNRYESNVRKWYSKRDAPNCGVTLSLTIFTNIMI